MKKILFSFVLTAVFCSMLQAQQGIEPARTGKSDVSACRIVEEEVIISKNFTRHINQEDVEEFSSSLWQIQYKVGSHAFNCVVTNYRSISATYLFRHGELPNFPFIIPAELVGDKKVGDFLIVNGLKKNNVILVLKIKTIHE